MKKVLPTADEINLAGNSIPIPWEVEKASVSSFFRTIKVLIIHPARAFSDSSRGGLSKAWLFYSLFLLPASISSVLIDNSILTIVLWSYLQGELIAEINGILPIIIALLRHWLSLIGIHILHNIWEPIALIICAKTAKAPRLSYAQILRIVLYVSIPVVFIPFGIVGKYIFSFSYNTLAFYGLKYGLKMSTSQALGILLVLHAINGVVFDILIMLIS